MQNRMKIPNKIEGRQAPFDLISYDFKRHDSFLKGVLLDAGERTNKTLPESDYMKLLTLSVMVNRMIIYV